MRREGLAGFSNHLLFNVYSHSIYMHVMKKFIINSHACTYYTRYTHAQMPRAECIIFVDKDNYE